MWCPPSPLAVKPFSGSSPAGFSKPRGERIIEDIPFRAECSKVPHFPNLIWLGESLNVFPSDAGGNFSEDMAEHIMVYEYNKMSLRVILFHLFHLP